MTMIQQLSESIGAARKWWSPIRREFTPANHYDEHQIDGRVKWIFYGALIAGAIIGPGLSSTAWTADLSSINPVKPRMVVAAGVGYENAETATITVKTYDAENGSILSDETYDLNVREDAATAGDRPRERIFAGGIGPGTDGLSAFRLRVYDSATGLFLWEGILNLGVGDQDFDSSHQAVAYLAPRQATVTQVSSRSAIGGQPQFFLRAVDMVTGELVWADHFVAGAGPLAHAERINRAVVGQTEGLMGPSQHIEFCIRMMDDRGRQMIWEDRMEPSVEGTDMTAGYNDEAENLPVWRGEGPEEMNKGSI